MESIQRNRELLFPVSSSKRKLKHIEHSQYMARLKASQTVKPLATGFLGCWKVYAGSEKGMAKNRRKAHSEAINIEISPQETFKGKSLGQYYGKASLNALFLYSCPPPLASPSCQCSRIDFGLISHSCAYTYIWKTGCKS